MHMHTCYSKLMKQETIDREKSETGHMHFEGEKGREKCNYDIISKIKIKSISLEVGAWLSL